MIVGFLNILKNNNMSWIDEVNKKLEEQRAAYKESINSGDAGKRKRSADAKNGGTITGNKHKESGHIQKLNDYPRAEGQRSAAAKIAGNKNIETGWVKEFQKIGTQAAIKKLNDKKLAEIKILYSIMEQNTLYSYKQLKDITTHVKNRRLGRLLIDDLAKPYIEVIKIKRLIFYKKIIK
jgi:hypothetical protein